MTVACTYNSGARYYKCTVIKLNRDLSAHVTFCDGYSWTAAPFSDFQPWVSVGDTARVVQGRRMEMVRVDEVREDGIVATPIKKNGTPSPQGSVFVADIDVQPDRDTPLKVQQAALKAARARQAAASADVYATRPDIVESVSRTGRRRTALQLRAPPADESSAGGPARKRVRVRSGDTGGSIAPDSDSGEEDNGEPEAGAGSGGRKRPLVSEAPADSDSDGEVLNYDSDDAPRGDGEDGEILEAEADRRALPDTVRDMPMADFCFEVVASFVASLRAYNVSTATLCAFPRYVEPCLLHPYHVVLEGRVQRSNLPASDKRRISGALEAAMASQNQWCADAAAANGGAPSPPRPAREPQPSAWLDPDDILPEVHPLQAADPADAREVYVPTVPPPRVDHSLALGMLTCSVVVASHLPIMCGQAKTEYQLFREQCILQLAPGKAVPGSGDPHNLRPTEWWLRWR